MPSSYRDPSPPAPNQPRRVAVDAIPELDLSPVQRPVIDASLAKRRSPVVA